MHPNIPIPTEVKFNKEFPIQPTKQSFMIDLILILKRVLYPQNHWTGKLQI